MSYSTVQPWGSSGATIIHNALIKDPSKRSTRINANVGLTYTFGSIFNNIVNPRFGSGNLF
jgi:hypothetical protein